jgi:DDE superfamily endonuclease
MSYVNRLDYCQFLLVTQTNYTLTYFADHRAGYSHDAVKRYLEEDKITARLVWENVRNQVVTSAEGYLVFDDTVLDKNSSFKIELVRRQYSGNAHAVIKGIGVVTCVYINPTLDQFWIIDYRIYDPDGDGKTKLDHVREMLDQALLDKQLPFRGVLMDSWYAERKLMLHIERLNKVYYCALKSNRLADDSDEARPYQRLENLTWTDEEQQHGKTIHVKDFPKGHRVTLFRLVRDPAHTDYIATNDVAQHSTQGTQQVCALRWKVEQFHRETKQTTGIEHAQCRLARMQRNHIGCAILVWVCLNRIAHETASTIYQLKHGLLDDYMFSQLRAPTILMQLA